MQTCPYCGGAMDWGRQPYVVNIHSATEANQAFRRTLWTGKHLQVTVMCINPGDSVGLEVHHELDQFLRVESGSGLVRMGDSRDQLTFERRVQAGDAILVPAGAWHDLINTGRVPLKLYSIYAPPAHDPGTIHWTKQQAMAAESAY
ncbi:cupin domain-containing protein [Lentibacillus sp. JNUCC-1]|uniref:cupin domain-containing protein n=1 Tax=Lentibacillus sp. JNUCC-1 TaxID=2654513 RepID=UPI001E47FB8A|nr:cupin domain-containing protein [Lentibacillus sp. JNUCC-1]